MIAAFRAWFQAACFALLALLIALVCALVQEARQTNAEVQHFLVDSHKRTNSALVHLDVVLGRAQITMGKVEMASRQQEVVAQKTVRLLDKTAVLLTSANETVQGINTDAAEIRQAAVLSLGELDETTRAARRTLQTGGVALRSANDAIKQVGVTLGDVQGLAPALHRSLDNTAVLTANAAETSADVRDYVHRKSQHEGLLRRAITYLLF